MEEGGERWSKPHVSSLPMEALMELQVLLTNCPVLLDLEAYKMSGVAGKIFHYENTPMFFKVEIFNRFFFFLNFAQNIDCEYTLEPPRRGGYYEYPTLYALCQNKKNRYIHLNPSFYYIKWGLMWYTFHGHVIVM